MSRSTLTKPQRRDSSHGPTLTEGLVALILIIILAVIAVPVIKENHDHPKYAHQTQLEQTAKERGLTVLNTQICGVSDTQLLAADHKAYSFVGAAPQLVKGAPYELAVKDGKVYLFGPANTHDYVLHC